MTLEETGAREPTGHGLHVAVDHIGGTVSLRIVKGEYKDIGFGAQLVDCCQSRAAECARKCCQEERRVTGYDYVLRKANHDLGASDGV